MITLYQYGNSVCAQKVRITLIEKGLEWETKNVDLFHGEQYRPEYLKINPKGLVPALVHGGEPITESTLICEYLDESFPAPRLAPDSARERARMRLWSKAVDESLHEGVTEISFSAMFRERMKSMSEEERQIRFRNVGSPRRRDRFMSTYAEGVESPYVMWAVGAYESAFKDMEKALSVPDARWLLGSDYTLADINLMPYVARLDYLGLLDLWIAERPKVRAWWQRAQARPSFRKAVHEPLTAGEKDRMQVCGAGIRERMRALREQLLEAFAA
jgi:glutathione S-transferase